MALHGFRHTISWKDYKTRNTRPPGEFRAHAKTVARVLQIGDLDVFKDDKGVFHFKPSSVFIEVSIDEVKSWVLRNSRSDELLQHEQVHYNISALAGRDLEREMLKLGGESVKALKESYAHLNSVIQETIHQVNDDYDDAFLWGTDHGVKESEQKMWESHINSQMNGINGELVSIYQTPYMARDRKV